MVYLVYENLKYKGRMRIMGSDSEEKVFLNQEQKDYIVNYYYEKDRKALKSICNKILSQIWNDVPFYYRDDFESVAGLTILQSLNTYNLKKGGQKLDDIRKYVNTSIKLNFISYIYNINNLKHGGDGNWDNEKRDENGKKVKKSVKVKFVNIDDKIKEGSESTYSDIIPGGKSVEEIIFEDKKDSKLEACINKLNKTQKKIVSLMIDGYKPNEIQERLQLTNKQYFDYVTDMRTSEFRLALEED